MSIRLLNTYGILANTPTHLIIFDFVSLTNVLTCSGLNHWDFNAGPVKGMFIIWCTYIAI